MELYYCDACGLRIKSGDGQIGADELRYCDSCFAKNNVAAPARSSTIRATTPQPGAIKSTAVISSPNDSSSRRKPSKQEPSRPGKSGPNTTLIAVGGSAAALLVVGFMLLGGKSEPQPVAMKETPPQTAKETKSESRPAAGLDKLEKSASTPGTSPAFKAPATLPNQVPAAEPAMAERARAAATEPSRNQTANTAEQKQEKGRAGGGMFAPGALQANSQDDYRENYARRRMTELLEIEQKGSMKPAEFRKRVKELASGYSNTAAGVEAAEKLKKLDENAAAPAAAAASDRKSSAPDTVSPAEQARLLLGTAAPAGEPERAQAQGETRILYRNTFDTEEEWKLVDGTKETVQTQTGTGVAVRSIPVSPGYFVAKVVLKFGQSPVKLGANSWMKISYRTQGTADICFHTAISSAVYEKFFFGIKPGKWQTLVLHFNQFGKCISRGNDSQPAPNSDLQGVTMFLGSNTDAGASAIVDDVIIGDGPVPQD